MSHAVDHVLIALQELLLALPFLLNPIIIVASLFFGISILLCVAAYGFLFFKRVFEMFSADGGVVNGGGDNKVDGVVNGDGRTVEKKPEGVGILKDFVYVGVMGYCIAVSFAIGGVLDLVLEKCW